MKIKASRLCLALLCLSLMLFHGSTSAQKNMSSTRKPRSAPSKKATPTPTPTPTTTLAGSYTLIDSAAATNKVTSAIEYSVKGMWLEGKARRKLTETNLPPPNWITIWYSAADFSIQTDQSGLIQTPPDGTSIKWTSKYKETYDVSTRWVGGNLERTFKSTRGRRVNTYSLSSNGKTLTMKVTGKTEGWLTPSFKHPFNYQLEYRRN